MAISDAMFLVLSAMSAIENMHSGSKMFVQRNNYAIYIMSF